MILGIVASLVILIAPITAFSEPAGPPGGLEVKIVDQPVEVMGDVNVVNDNTNPVPVIVKNEGELVILREGYTVPEGKTLKIVDISIRATLRRPSYKSDSHPDPRLLFNPAMATPLLRIYYPNDKCPEPLVQSTENSMWFCPEQDHSLGVAANDAADAGYNDDESLMEIMAGRQVHIIATEGATLYGIIPGNGTNVFSEGISCGIGYLLSNE